MFTSVIHLCLPLWTLKLIDLNFAWVPIWPLDSLVIYILSLHVIYILGLMFGGLLCAAIWEHPPVPNWYMYVSNEKNKWRKSPTDWNCCMAACAVLVFEWYSNTFFVLKCNLGNCSCFAAKLIMFSVVIKWFNRGFPFFSTPHHGYSCIWLIIFGS